MEKVPQIVTERLKAAAPAVDHPDADLLTAFSERLLPPAERAVVLDHLARCGECREVVAFALPASEPVQEIVRVSNAGWLTWPVLRWGFIAAGIVAIASFGVVQYQRKRVGPLMMASNASRLEAVAKKAENVPPPPLPSAEPTQERDKMQSAPASIPAERSDRLSTTTNPKDMRDLEAVASSVQAKPIGGPSRAVLPHGPRVQWQQNTNNVQQQAPAPAAPQMVAGQMRSDEVSANSPVPARSEALKAQAQTGVAGGQAPNFDTPVLESQRIDQQPSDSGHDELKVEKIKPAETVLATASKGIAADRMPPGAPAGAPLNRRNLAQSPGSSIRWTINSAGGLQRSIDQGSTWQDVDVNISAPAAGDELAVMKTSRAKEATNENLKKKDASLVFRAVAASGTEVWAGATDGLLYHSTDAGTHWTRVVPSSSSVTLTGDIVSLEFIDPQHGRIVTSAPEVWTTSDAGQSWQKQ